MTRLGINIDHVATLRNARGEVHPDPYKAALNVMKYGADSITIHLREDRRHIKDFDLRKIARNKKVMDDILEKKKQENERSSVTKNANLKIFMSSIFFPTQIKTKLLSKVADA